MWAQRAEERLPVPDGPLLRDADHRYHRPASLGLCAWDLVCCGVGSGVPRNNSPGHGRISRVSWAVGRVSGENKFLGFGVQKLLQFSELAASLLPSPAQAFASKLTASGWPRSAGSSSSSRNWSARCVAAGGGRGRGHLTASCAGLGVPLVSLCYKLPAVNDGFVKHRAHAWSP